MSIIHKFNLLEHSADREYILALSGGLDSVVLLDLLVKHQPKLKLTAVYINHKLQTDSDLWVKTNANICKSYNIPYSYYNLNFSKKSGESLEAQARAERYKVFTMLVDAPNKVLLTGHHMNDQAETFLLQLMRGAGPKGLSAMPVIKKFSQGLHLRPMLELSRAELLEYAQQNKLAWVEDKTNRELLFDRNYLRNIIIPALEQRWPQTVFNIAKSANHNANHESLLNHYVGNDYQSCKSNDLSDWILDITKLAALSDIKKIAAVLRYWFERLNFLMPSKKILRQIINNCILNTNNSSNPQVITGNQVVTRYKNKLYVLDHNAYLAECTQTFDYILGQDLYIDELKIKISSKLVEKNTMASNGSLDLISQCNISQFIKINQHNANNQVTIKFRNGGEHCRPTGRGGSVSIKKLLQEHKIPPWQRNKIPILYVGDDIAAILGVKVCEGFVADSGDAGWLITVEHDESSNYISIE